MSNANKRVRELSGHDLDQAVMPPYDRLRADALAPLALEAAELKQSIAMTSAGLRQFAQAWRERAGALLQTPQAGAGERTLGEHMPGLAAAGAVPAQGSLKEAVDNIVANAQSAPALARVIDAQSGQPLQRWSPEVMAEVAQQLEQQYESLATSLQSLGGQADKGRGDTQRQAG